MFHKIKSVTPLQDYKLSIQFSEGITKIYDVKNLIKNNKMFKELENKELFDSIQIQIVVLNCKMMK